MNETLAFADCERSEQRRWTGYYTVCEVREGVVNFSSPPNPPLITILVLGTSIDQECIISQLSRPLFTPLAAAMILGGASFPKYSSLQPWPLEKGCLDSLCPSRAGRTLLGGCLAPWRGVEVHITKQHRGYPIFSHYSPCSALYIGINNCFGGIASKPDI